MLEQQVIASDYGFNYWLQKPKFIGLFDVYEWVHLQLHARLKPIELLLLNNNDDDNCDDDDDDDNNNYKLIS